MIGVISTILTSCGHSTDSTITEAGLMAQMRSQGTRNNVDILVWLVRGRYSVLLEMFRSSVRQFVKGGVF